MSGIPFAQIQKEFLASPQYGQGLSMTEFARLRNAQTGTLAYSGADNPFEVALKTPTAWIDRALDSMFPALRPATGEVFGDIFEGVGLNRTYGEHVGQDFAGAGTVAMLPMLLGVAGASVASGGTLPAVLAGGGTALTALLAGMNAFEKTDSGVAGLATGGLMALTPGVALAGGKLALGAGGAVARQFGNKVFAQTPGTMLPGAAAVTAGEKTLEFLGQNLAAEVPFAISEWLQSGLPASDFFTDPNYLLAVGLTEAPFALATAPFYFKKPSEQLLADRRAIAERTARNEIQQEAAETQVEQAQQQAVATGDPDVEVNVPYSPAGRADFLANAREQLLGWAEGEFQQEADARNIEDTTHPNYDPDIHYAFDQDVEARRANIMALLTDLSNNTRNEDVLFGDQAQQLFVELREVVREKRSGTEQRIAQPEQWNPATTPWEFVNNALKDTVSRIESEFEARVTGDVVGTIEQELESTGDVGEAARNTDQLLHEETRSEGNADNLPFADAESPVPNRPLFEKTEIDAFTNEFWRAQNFMVRLAANFKMERLLPFQNRKQMELAIRRNPREVETVLKQFAHDVNAEAARRGLPNPINVKGTLRQAPAFVSKLEKESFSIAGMEFNDKDQYDSVALEKELYSRGVYVEGFMDSHFFKSKLDKEGMITGADLRTALIESVGNQMAYHNIPKSFRKQLEITRGAQFDPSAETAARMEGSTVIVNQNKLAAQFLEKSWTKPAIEGVEALHENFFDTPQGYFEFVIAHEHLHTQNKKFPRESTAEYENRINRLAIEKLGLEKRRPRTRAEALRRARDLGVTRLREAVDSFEKEGEGRKAAIRFIRDTWDLGAQISALEFALKDNGALARDLRLELASKYKKDPEALVETLEQMKLIYEQRKDFMLNSLEFHQAMRDLRFRKADGTPLSEAQVRDYRFAHDAESKDVEILNESDWDLGNAGAQEQDVGTIIKGRSTEANSKELQELQAELDTFKAKSGKNKGEIKKSLTKAQRDRVAAIQNKIKLLSAEKDVRVRRQAEPEDFGTRKAAFLEAIKSEAFNEANLALFAKWPIKFMKNIPENLAMFSDDFRIAVKNLWEELTFSEFPESPWNYSVFAQALQEMFETPNLDHQKFLDNYAFVREGRIAEIQRKKREGSGGEAAGRPAYRSINDVIDYTLRRPVAGKRKYGGTISAEHAEARDAAKALYNHPSTPILNSLRDVPIHLDPTNRVGVNKHLPDLSALPAPVADILFSSFSSDYGETVGFTLNRLLEHFPEFDKDRYDTNHPAFIKRLNEEIDLLKKAYEIASKEEGFDTLPADYQQKLIIDSLGNLHESRPKTESGFFNSARTLRATHSVDDLNVRFEDGTEGKPPAPGLKKSSNVFDEDEIQRVTQEIEWLENNPDQLHNPQYTYVKTGTAGKKNERTQINFGYYFSYGFGVEGVDAVRGVKDPSQVAVEPMPLWMNEMIDRLVAEGVISASERPNSALINIYPEGTGAIPPHVDHLPSFNRPILTVRFGAPTRMSFGWKPTGVSEKAKAQAQPGVKPFSVELGVGDVHVMSDKVADTLTHAIFSDDVSKGKSYSITFRTTKPSLATNEAPSYFRKPSGSTGETQAGKTYSGTVVTLKPNQVFVFTSNLRGFHGAGSAGYASFNVAGNRWREQGYREKPDGWKGKWNEKGKSEGYQEGTEGRSYALPTVVEPSKPPKPLSESAIRQSVEKFYEFARQNPDKEFLVADLSKGGLSGITPETFASLFSGDIPPNVVFSEGFAKMVKRSSDSTGENQTFEIVDRNDPSADLIGMRALGKNMRTAKPGEPGWLGNPFAWAGNGGPKERTVDQAIAMFEAEFLERVEKDPEFRQAVLGLRGKKVGYYKPKSEKNHLKIVQDWLRKQPVEEVQATSRVEREVRPYNPAERTFDETMAEAQRNVEIGNRSGAREYDIYDYEGVDFTTAMDEMARRRVGEMQFALIDKGVIPRAFDSNSVSLERKLPGQLDMLIDRIGAKVGLYEAERNVMIEMLKTLGEVLPMGDVTFGEFVNDMLLGGGKEALGLHVTTVSGARKVFLGAVSGVDRMPKKYVPLLYKFALAHELGHNLDVVAKTGKLRPEVAGIITKFSDSINEMSLQDRKAMVEAAYDLWVPRGFKKLKDVKKILEGVENPAEVRANMLAMFALKATDGSASSLDFGLLPRPVMKMFRLMAQRMEKAVKVVKSYMGLKDGHDSWAKKQVEDLEANLAVLRKAANSAEGMFQEFRKLADVVEPERMFASSLKLQDLEGKQTDEDFFQWATVAGNDPSFLDASGRMASRWMERSEQLAERVPPVRPLLTALFSMSEGIRSWQSQIMAEPVGGLTAAGGIKVLGNDLWQTYKRIAKGGKGNLNLEMSTVMRALQSIERIPTDPLQPGASFSFQELLNGAQSEYRLAKKRAKDPAFTAEWERYRTVMADMTEVIKLQSLSAEDKNVIEVQMNKHLQSMRTLQNLVETNRIELAYYSLSTSMVDILKDRKANTMPISHDTVYALSKKMVDASILMNVEAVRQGGGFTRRDPALVARAQQMHAEVQAELQQMGFGSLVFHPLQDKANKLAGLPATSPQKMQQGYTYESGIGLLREMFAKRRFFFNEGTYGNYEVRYTVGGHPMSMRIKSTKEFAQVKRQLESRGAKDVRAPVFHKSKGLVGQDPALMRLITSLDEERGDYLSRLNQMGVITQDTFDILMQMQTGEVVRTEREIGRLSPQGGEKRGFDLHRSFLDMVEGHREYVGIVSQMENDLLMRAKLRFHKANPELDPYADHISQVDRMIDNFKVGDSEVGRALSKGIFAYAMGFNLASHALEMIQPMMSVLPQMAAEGVPTGEAIRELWKASKQIHKYNIEHFKDRKSGDDTAAWGKVITDQVELEETLALHKAIAGRGLISLSHLSELVEGPMEGALNFGHASTKGRLQAAGEIASKPFKVYGDLSGHLYSIFTHTNARISMKAGLGIAKAKAKARVDAIDALIAKTPANDKATLAKLAVERRAALDAGGDPSKVMVQDPRNPSRRIINPAIADEVAQFIRVTTFGSGRAGRPEMPFSTGDSAFYRTMAQSMYALQSYVTGMVSMAARYAQHAYGGKEYDFLTPTQRKNARRALNIMLSTMFMSAGMMGMPFVGAVLAEVEEQTEWEPKRNIREGLAWLFNEDSEDGGFFTDAILRGPVNALLALTPFQPDIGSRMSIGGVLGANDYDGFDTKFVFGPTGDIVNNVATGLRDFSLGRVGSGMENLAPVSMKRIINMLRHDGEFIDSYGNKSIEGTNWDRAVMAMGFTPQRLSNFRDANRTMRRSLEIQQAKDNRFKEKVASIAKEDPATARAMLEEYASENPGFDSKAAARMVARRVVKKEFPRDLRREASGRFSSSGRALLEAYQGMGLPSTEFARLSRENQILQGLGFSAPLDQRRIDEAVALDQLMNTQFVTRQQAKQQLKSASQNPFAAF